MLEENLGVRIVFRDSAEFVVQCTATESGLPISVSKDVEILREPWGVFFFLLPLRFLAGVAWTAVVLARVMSALNVTPKKTFSSSQQTWVSYLCNAGQRRNKAEETEPCLKRSELKDEMWQVCVTVDQNKIGMKGENNSERKWVSNYMDLVLWNYSALTYLIGWSEETNQRVIKRS